MIMWDEPLFPINLGCWLMDNDDFSLKLGYFVGIMSAFIGKGVRKRDYHIPFDVTLWDRIKP